MRVALLFMLTMLAPICGADATPITITGSGTWASNAPTTDLSAPNQPWTLSFDVDSPIPLTNVDDGLGQSVPVTNATYELSGAAVGTIVDARFFSAALDGMFTVDFIGVSDPSDLDFYGPEVFARPTGELIPGSYAAVSDVGVTNLPDGVGPASITIQPASAPAAVPEPTTLSLLAFGLAGMGVRRWRRNRQSRR
jgi:hypothetical protein